MRSMLMGVVAVLAVGCGVPTMGDPCDQAGSGTCDGKDAIVWCQSGRYARFLCPGPRGCFNGASCDFAGSKEGDPCPIGTSPAFCANSTSLLRCKSGSFQREQCSSCSTDNYGLSSCTP